MANKIFSIKNTKGKSVFKAECASYNEALLKYLAINGNLRDLDHSGKTLTGIVLPDKTDLSGSIFGKKTNFRQITAKECKFDNCIFQDIHAVSLILSGSTFLNADFMDSVFESFNVNFGDFTGANIIKTQFRTCHGFKAVLDDTQIEDSKIINSKIPFASFVNSTCMNVDFCGTRFVPEKFAGKEGKKFWKKAFDTNNNKDIGVIEWISSLYEKAKFIGCNYNDKTVIPTAIRDFPADYRYQNYARGGANIAITGFMYEGVETVNRTLENIMNSDVMHSHLINNVAPYLDHIHPGTVGILGAGALLAIGLINDKMKDLIDDVARQVVGKGWRMMNVTKATILDSMKDMAHLTVLAGRRADLAPIRAALIATSLGWTRINKKWQFQNRFWSVALDTGRIIVCNKSHLEQALELLENFKNSNTKRVHKRVTLVSHDHRTTDHPTAISISPNQSVRAVWRVRDENYDGHITYAWDGNGNVMHSGSVPEIADDKLRELLAKHPEIQSAIRGGPKACLTKMIRPLIEKSDNHPTVSQTVTDKVTAFLKYPENKTENEEIALSS